jgi:hypothetical protein
MTDRNLIGFDRRLDKEWLDAAAAIMAGQAPAGVRDPLKQLLKPGHGPEGVAKTLAAIGRLWWRAPQAMAPMQERALTLIPEVNPTERMAIHWALCLAVYPFFLDTARLTGRLLGLQDEVKWYQVITGIWKRWTQKNGCRI